MEEGATVFLTYTTILSMLTMQKDFLNGDAILIHAGSGGVDLSAIHLATHLGLEIFTTVNTEEKRQYLLKLFQNIKPENIGNSRNTSFMVMKNTKGKGVKMVINSLADDKLLASIKCLHSDGLFLEIGKSDIFRDNKINLRPFGKGLTFKSVIVDVMHLIERVDTLSEFKKSFNSNIIKPLKATVFEASQLEDAFRFMASGKHIGKILIKIRDENGLLLKEISPRIYFNPQHSYIICGGLGGFGMELADWMILRGCRKIVLSSSRGKTDVYHVYRFTLWKSYGVEIKISTCKITTESGCNDLIEEASQLGPVGGIFNLAAKLSDALFENQTIENFEQCNGPKGIATKFLDEVSRKKCPELEHFVAFSSVACGLGNVGQTNYGLANSIMERIIENRKREGFPAKAIQWGPIGSVGMFMAESKDYTNVKIGAMIFQNIDSCLEVMDSLLTSEDPIVCSYIFEEKHFSTGKKDEMASRLLKIMGIKDVNAYPKDTKILDFGMDSLLSVEIVQYAETVMNVILTADDLRSMTLGTILEMIENANKVNEENEHDKKP